MKQLILILLILPSLLIAKEIPEQYFSVIGAHLSESAYNEFLDYEKEKFLNHWQSESEIKEFSFVSTKIMNEKWGTVKSYKEFPSPSINNKEFMENSIFPKSVGLFTVFFSNNKIQAIEFDNGVKLKRWKY